LYFVYRGKCIELLPTRTGIGFERGLFPAEIREKNEFLILNEIGRGDTFGENSAINNKPHRFTV
jgi:hypothetical protein